MDAEQCSETTDPTAERRRAVEFGSNFHEAQVVKQIQRQRRAAGSVAARGIHGANESDPAHQQCFVRRRRRTGCARRRRSWLASKRKRRKKEEPRHHLHVRSKRRARPRLQERGRRNAAFVLITGRGCASRATPPCGLSENDPSSSSGSAISPRPRFTAVASNSP